MFKKLKQEIKVKINGLLFYLIIKRGNSDNIEQIFEKPDLKQMSEGHVTGEHRLINNPSENHFDHFSGLSNWKEYPEKEGKVFQSKYWISGTKIRVISSWNSTASFAIVDNNPAIFLS